MSTSSGVKLPQIVLLDVEGTTTSISFVKDVLFPYARKEMEAFVRNHWTENEIQEIISLVRAQSVDDVQAGLLKKPLPTPEEQNDEEILIQSVLSNLMWQMDNDRKTVGLKALQGKIWHEGYKSGVLKGHIYEDVPASFEQWVEAGRKLYIYSSGSIQAQILLFKSSEAGDLTKYLSGHFDTTSGPKVESKSYINIASTIGTDSQNILFLTDVAKEAYAAKEAGMQVIIMIRPGNVPLSSSELSDFETAHSFEEFNHQIAE